jgi:hypothetical protein
VEATLVSENPAPVLVESGETTEVALRFELHDGTLLSNARGKLDVRLDLAAPDPADAGAAECVDGLRIDELDYDQPGADDAEFVEVLNTASCDARLDAVRLELVNGGDGKVYGSYPLANAGSRLPAKARLLVADPSVLDAVPAGVLTLPLKAAGLQNGPDGLRLVAAQSASDGSAGTQGQADDGDRVLDALAYEGPVPGAGEGTPSGADDAELALARCPDGYDGDDNALDFMLVTPTPGAPNLCGDGA